jgi:hypothetical protein
MNEASRGGLVARFDLSIASTVEIEGNECPGQRPPPSQLGSHVLRHRRARPRCARSAERAEN